MSLPLLNSQSSSSDADGRPAWNDLSFDEWKEWLADNGEKPFRAKQIRRQVYSKRAASFDEMTDIPASLRAKLAAAFRYRALEPVQHQVASDRTEKRLLKLQDGELVECVLMRETRRRTVCISTQVGCAMGCVFCASGLLGVKRDLTVGEIVDQVLIMQQHLGPDEELTNVVVMGIGEPLANYKTLMAALQRLTDPEELGLGARRITVSTVGLPDKIREFARSGKQFNLAVSLHAPNDALRTEIVPVNKAIGIEEVLAAADDFFEVTGRRISYEYVLLAGVNDGPDHATELADRLRHRNAHVNLIPMNGVAETGMQAPDSPATSRFSRILNDRGVVTTVRKRKGADIDAACGQLRLNRSREDAGENRSI